MDPSVPTLIRRFSHLAWANRASLQSLQAVSEPPPRAVAIMAHLPATERNWRARLGFAPRPGDELPIWPSIALDEISRHLEALATEWPGILETIAEGGLDRVVCDSRSTGQPFALQAADILEHLLSHGSNHRGRIATWLGSVGCPSVSTDYSYWIHRGGPSARISRVTGGVSLSNPEERLE